MSKITTIKQDNELDRMLNDQKASIANVGIKRRFHNFEDWWKWVRKH